jgi:hypothetical protein
LRKYLNSYKLYNNYKSALLKRVLSIREAPGDGIRLIET